MCPRDTATSWKDAEVDPSYDYRNFSKGIPVRLRLLVGDFYVMSRLDNIKAVWKLSTRQPVWAVKHRSGQSSVMIHYNNPFMLERYA